jgi:hypothetical protein
MEKLIPCKLSEVEATEQDCAEISNRFSPLEDLDAEMNIIVLWELLERV